MTSQPIKPSDIAMFVIGLGMFLFICWVMHNGMKRAESTGNENAFGCDLMLGFVVLFILGALAVALLTVFQGMYPGQ